MPSSGTTDYLGLNQYNRDNTDHPSWIEDVNHCWSTIDAECAGLNARVTALENDSLESRIVNIEGVLGIIYVTPSSKDKS